MYIVRSRSDNRTTVRLLAGHSEFSHNETLTTTLPLQEHSFLLGLGFRV
jgi:hypothetical protein